MLNLSYYYFTYLHVSRLYSRLAEVQAKKQEDDRKQKYANNREKAKEYNRVSIFKI